MNHNDFGIGKRRGFWEIGIYGNKTPANLGVLWRSASLFKANGIFTIGQRYPKKCQPSDTRKTYKHIPLREYGDFECFLKSVPRETKVIAIEIAAGSKNLRQFKHPERAIYILGAEDDGLPENVLKSCDHVVHIPMEQSMNVAACGSIICYDRIFGKYPELLTKEG